MTTTTTTADTDTAQRVAANTRAGLDLLAKGVAHGLPAPFRVEGTEHSATLQFDSHQDVQRWASYVGIEVTYTRQDDHLHARAFGRWQDRPVELCSSDSIAFLTDSTCPSCDGSGEVPTGFREHDTGAWKTVDCGLCDATGTLAVRA